jgi:hypothetical protein
MVSMEPEAGVAGGVDSDKWSGISEIKSVSDGVIGWWEFGS